MMEFLRNISLVDWLLLISTLCICTLLVAFAFKVYRIFRPPKMVKVNCWFCNNNSRVPYGNRNCFNCPHCKQYNGFDQSGHYNKLIPAQYHEEFNQPPGRGSSDKVHHQRERAPVSSSSLSEGGLCDQCNVNQSMKVQQLAAFVPYVEANFDAEVEHFEDYLEELYPLCTMCEETLHWVLRNQQQQMKMKLIGRMLQESRPSSPAGSSKPASLPMYIILLRLTTVLCVVTCLLIDLQQLDVVDVKTRLLKPVIADLPPIDMHRPSIILTGLACVILAALLAGKDRLRYIDATLPFILLLSLSLSWKPPPWLSSLHIVEFIQQFPWLQNIDAWLRWRLCWHLGVSISCVLCSLVFLVSSKQVVRKRKFKRRDSFNHNQNQSPNSSSASPMSDESPCQQDINDVSMTSDTMTPPATRNHHHQRGALDESVDNGLSFHDDDVPAADQSNPLQGLRQQMVKDL